VTVDLADLLTVEQLRVLAEKHGFDLTPRVVEPPAPAVDAVKAEKKRIPRTISMKGEPLKTARLECLLEGCTEPPRVNPPGTRGRKPQFCSDEHKAAHKRVPSKAAAGVVKDRPLPATPAAPAPLALPSSARVCGRCDSPEHSVIDCPVPYRSRTAKKAAKAAARKPAAVTLTPVGKEGFAVTNIDVRTREEREADRAHLTQQPITVEGTGSVTDEELAASASGLMKAWRTGLPAAVGFEYLPDVLALYGLDQEMVESCLRNPDRVELRPESYDEKKRYVVLGFHKADVHVILGLKDRAHPCVIAVYVSAMLENDHHRVGHTGGGGKKKQAGPPKNPRALLQALHDLGCRTTRDASNNAHVHVEYGGQDLGMVRAGDIYDRRDVDSDWNRMQRKVHAIKQREAS
jgi:hypothetical protein